MKRVIDWMQPRTSLPWLGVRALGFGGAYVEPAPDPSRDTFVSGGSLVRNDGERSRWARLVSGGVVELRPGVPTKVAEAIVGLSDEPLTERQAEL
jgi:hypothetical protein